MLCHCSCARVYVEEDKTMEERIYREKGFSAEAKLATEYRRVRV